MDISLASALSAAPVVAASSDKVSATARASIVIHLHAAPDRAFPMFDPVNESRWAPDWSPTLLGDGRVAAGLVFTTTDQYGRATWLLDRYDPATYSLRYVTVRTTTLNTIDIAVVVAGDHKSTATVTYTRTALDARGVDNVNNLATHFSSEAPHWEAAINAALDAPAKGGAATSVP